MATEWYLAKKEELTEIATAIRNLNGGNAGLKLNDMKNAINTEKSNLEAVKTALKEKGVTVADGAVLSDLSGLIDGIETSNGKYVKGSFTVTSDNCLDYTIEHNLGVIPTFAFIYAESATPTQGRLYPYRSKGYFVCPNPIEESPNGIFSLVTMPTRDATKFYVFSYLDNGGYRLTDTQTGRFCQFIGLSTENLIWKGYMDNNFTALFPGIEYKYIVGVF